MKNHRNFWLKFMAILALVGILLSAIGTFWITSISTPTTVTTSSSLSDGQ